MGTDRGVGGGVRVRKVVVRGRQGEGDDSFRACYMKAVRGHECARTTTMGSATLARDVCGRYVPRQSVGDRGLSECAWEGGYHQHCHLDDELEREGWRWRMTEKKRGKSAKGRLEHAGLIGESGEVDTVGGD